MTDPNPVERPQRVEVGRVGDEHAEPLAAFFRAVWDPGATPASVREGWARMAAENLAQPGEVPPTFVVQVDDRVVGYLSSLPVRVWAGGRDAPAYWAKGLMVLPEFRNGPIGFSLLKAAVQANSRSLVLTVAPASRRLFGAMGYLDLGPVPNYLRLLRAGRILGRLDLSRLEMNRVPRWAAAGLRLAQRVRVAGLAGHAAGGALRVAAAIAGRPGGALTVATSSEPPDSAALDALWAAVRDQFPPSVVRDGAYLRSRYSPLHGGGARYEWVSARRDSALAAVAVVRRPGEGDPRLGGIRLATLADLVCAPRDAGAALAALRGAEALARAGDADGILATVSDASAARWLRRRAYLSIGGNVHFLTRNQTDDATAWSPALDQWWLMRGDGESDAAL